MAKSTVWRVTAVDTQGQPLALSRLRLLQSGTRVDAGAVLTCTVMPTSGDLSELLNDSADACRFDAADVAAPGFQLVFTLPAAQEVNGVELGLVATDFAPVALTLECFVDGVYVVQKVFKGIVTGGSPKVQPVGEIIAGTPQQGYIVAVSAGSGQPQFNAFDRSAPTWDANFRETIDIGLFAYKGTNPGDTGVQPTKTINQFSINDELFLYQLNGSWNPDYADMDMEFLRADGTVVAAIRTEYRSSYANKMRFGASLSALTDAPYSGSYPRIEGPLTFTATSMTFKPVVGGTENNHAEWTFPAAFADVVALRFSRVRATSNYGGGAVATVSVKRTAGVERVGYTGDLPYRRTTSLRAWAVNSAVTAAQGASRTQVLGVEKVLDAECGGRGVFYGTVKDHETKQLLQRRVRLFRSRDSLLVREVWSAADGSYRFEGISERYEYDIEAWDHEKNHFTAVANNQLPEVAP